MEPLAIYSRTVVIAGAGPWPARRRARKRAIARFREAGAADCGQLGHQPAGDEGRVDGDRRLLGVEPPKKRR